MARKRMAKPEEIEKAYRSALQHIGESVLSPGAPRTIKKRLIQLQREYQTWVHILWLRKSLPRKQLRALFVPDAKHLKKMRAESRKVRLTAEDLEQLMRPMHAIADIMAGKQVELLQQPQALFKTMQRLSRPEIPSVRRFKPAFERAFCLQTEASQSDKVITATTLAQKLTAYEYKRNPESALRAMQRGIDRVRAEHERCLKEGLVSPFLAPEHQNQKLKRSRT